MKRLWKTIPPCYSDVLGFEAVLNGIDGLGIVDDPSKYKGLRKKGRHDVSEKDGNHVRCSDIREADIIRGTRQKMLDAFACGVSGQNPEVVLLSYAPSSSMIGSDLEEIAEVIQKQSGIPAASVEIHGDKEYLYGISVTLEAIGRLLLKKQRIIPGTVNLLGMNPFDWADESCTSIRALLKKEGYQVLSCWGIKETAENLRAAAGASANLVVNISGFRLAKYMEEKFGIPYVVGAPFGQSQMTSLIEELKEKTGSKLLETEADLAVEDMKKSGTAEAGMISDEQRNSEVQVLVIGEQLTANAIRSAVRNLGFRRIQVVSFYEMERDWMLPGDKRLAGEDEFAQMLGQPSLQMVLGNPDYKMAGNTRAVWINLPNGAGHPPVNKVSNFDMTGRKLDTWLEKAIREDLLKNNDER